MPKIGNYSIGRHPFFSRESIIYTLITTIDMYFLIEIRHDILIQCYLNDIEVKHSIIHLK